jgi:hypothetical protein
MEDNSLRAFICPSSPHADVPRTRTPVDLVLPPLKAFHTEGWCGVLCYIWQISDGCSSGAANTLWPPVLGQKAIRWPDVFALIKQPQYLYDVYKPSHASFDKMSLESIWECWNTGEAVYDDGGNVSGVKPPLREVEQQFGSEWRKGPQVCWLLIMGLVKSCLVTAIQRPESGSRDSVRSRSGSIPRCDCRLYLITSSWSNWKPCGDPRESLQWV